MLIVIFFLFSVTEVLGSDDNIHSTADEHSQTFRSPLSLCLSFPNRSSLPLCPLFLARTGSGWHRWSSVSVPVAVAVAVVAEVSAGARNAVETTGADAGADVVGDVVHVQLTKIVAVRRHDPVWCMLESGDVVVSVGSDVAGVGGRDQDNKHDQH